MKRLAHKKQPVRKRVLSKSTFRALKFMQKTV